MATIRIMRHQAILTRYIFREMIPPFAINLVFFTFIFLMAKILEITNLIVNYRISVAAVVLMILFYMPYFLVFVIPMSVMATVLLTFLRLSGDNEVIALKAGGISTRGVLPAVFLFCFLGWLLTSVMIFYGLPWGNQARNGVLAKMAAHNANLGLKERTFNDSFKDVMLYVNKVDLKNDNLFDIFIEDQRQADSVSTVVAPRGKLYSLPDRPVFLLRLFDGTINQVGLKDRTAHSIRFHTYDIHLNLEEALATMKTDARDEKEMHFSELRRYLAQAPEKDEKYFAVLMEFHRKFSIPFSCFVLGLLAVPLGIQLRAARRSVGLGLGLAFFLFYYLLLSAAKVYGENGAYPPVLGMWMPNIVLGGIGILMLRRTER